jgi:cyclically-permuted mutarotase family protein
MIFENLVDLIKLKLINVEAFFKRACMMKKIILLLLISIFGFSILPSCGQNSPHKNDMIKWGHLPDIPDTLGLAGAFVGKQKSTIVFAGGANFPDKPPWKGGKKVFYNGIYILTPNSSGYHWYSNQKLKLPHPLAYGVTVSTKKGIILIGGTNGKQVYKTVLRIHWDSGHNSIHIEHLPDLPMPLAFMSGAKLNHKIFIAGGQTSTESTSATKAFYQLDLNNLSNSWTKLPSWPGPKRVLSVAGAQYYNHHLNFFLFSGRNFKPDGSVELLNDAYRYNPVNQKWTKLTPIKIDGQEHCIMGAPSIALGDSLIMVFGGDPGRELKKRVQLANKIDSLKNLMKGPKIHHKIQSLQGILDSLTVHASAYSDDILAYHPNKDSWDKDLSIPSPSPVTTDAVKWKHSIVIPSGEIYPGVRTPHVLRGKVQSNDETHIK